MNLASNGHATNGNTPPWLRVEGEQIPDELKFLEQWVCWRALPGKNGAKPRKLPNDPVEQRNASCDDPATWNSWNDCWQQYRDRFPYVAGVGFEFSVDDGYAGIDLDKCRNLETGELHPTALEILGRIKSYAEVSPSGTGVKLIVRGELPHDTRRKAAIDGIEVEVYDNGRFFALTGHVVDDDHREIVEAQKALDEIVARIQSAKASKAETAEQPANRVILSQSPSSDAIFRRALSRAISVKCGEENDGSRRLLTVAIIAVPMDLSDAEACRLVSEVHRIAPFPTEFNDWDVLRRLRDAEKKTVRGKSLTTTASAPPTAVGEPDAKLSLYFADARTERGNSRRLVARHGKRLRYCAPWRKWLYWDDRRWQVDQTRHIEAITKDVLADLWDDVARINKDGADDKLRQAVATFAKSSNSANGVRNTLALARSEPGVPILPNELDSHPWRFNVLNGTIDLRTGSLHKHCRDDLLTKIAPVEYRATATCPRWLAFLDRIMDGNQSLIGFLQRAAGMSLCGAIRDHVLLVCFGTGRNGKSVFLNTLQRVVGEDFGMKAAADLLMTKGKGDSHPTEKADLFGKRFISCIEVEDGARIAESLVKELTGGDNVRARRMREDYWEFTPQHHLWLAVNHKPVVRGVDEGIWRRLKLIPFAVTIPEEEVDAELPERLAEELPGILAWMVQGARDWFEYGLGEPAEVRAATACYRDNMDTLGEFLDDVCEVDSRHSVSAADLYSAYVNWANKSGEFVHSKKKLGMLLDDRGFKRYRKNGPWYRGLKVKSQLES